MHEVFGAKSEDYRPGFSPAEVVWAKLHINADELEQLLATSSTEYPLGANSSGFYGTRHGFGDNWE